MLDEAQPRYWMKPSPTNVLLFPKEKYTVIIMCILLNFVTCKGCQMTDFVMITLHCFV